MPPRLILWLPRDVVPARQQIGVIIRPEEVVHAVEPPAATARSTYAREAPLSPGRASAASAAAMEATTANISESVNAALYLRMDSYFTSNSHEEGGPSHVA